MDRGILSPAGGRGWTASQAPREVQGTATAENKFGAFLASEKTSGETIA